MTVERQRTSPDMWALATLALLLLALYAHVGAKLDYDWYDLADDSHGFLVPLFAGYMLWERREKLRDLPRTQSWMGLSLVLPALFLLIVGIFGADLFLSRISFVLLLAGLVWTLLGWTFLREVRFILLVLLLAIPLPTIVLQQITFPLQLQASRISGVVLPWFGVPVVQAGNVIQLPSMQLEVAEACSGIRSLMSLFTVAVCYGYFMEPTVWRRVVLAMASLPIAVAANCVRIIGTGLCVQYWNPDKALGFFHEFSGWLMFLVSLLCLYALHSLMLLRTRRPAAA